MKNQPPGTDTNPTAKKLLSGTQPAAHRRTARKLPGNTNQNQPANADTTTTAKKLLSGTQPAAHHRTTRKLIGDTNEKPTGPLQP